MMAQATASGSEAERLEAFRQVRDGLRKRVFSYLEQALADSEGGPKAGLDFRL
jgi:hypothetical protein